MKLLLPFLASLHIMLGQALQDCPTSSGWSSADSICYRIVHFPESFWAAKAWCKAVQGDLLSLEHVKEVEAQVGKAMQGNAGDYRIDGWADGQWFHKENESLVSFNYELLNALDEKTLTVNLQDWQVTGDTEMGSRLGFICEGKAEDLAGTCSKRLENIGCFKGNDVNESRTNVGHLGFDPEACAARCRQEFGGSNILYAMVRAETGAGGGSFVGACACRTSRPSAQITDSEACLRKCEDNEEYVDQFCGDAILYSVYLVPGSVG